MPEGFVDLRQQRDGRGFWYWLAFLQPPIWVSVSSGRIRRLLQLCADLLPHSMDQDQIAITVNDRNSAEMKETAGAAVGEAFNAHNGSKEADSGSQPQNLNITSDAQEVQAGNTLMNDVERRIRTLARVQLLEPTKVNMWKVAFEHYSEKLRTSENLVHRREEEIRSNKNEIYQVVGFFSAFQGLLITATAQSNLLRCNNVGFILALSAFATAVAVFGIWQKITGMEKLRFDNINLQGPIQNFENCLTHLRRSGIDCDIDSLEEWSVPRRASRTPWKEISVSYGTWLVLSVIAFGGLCMVAMRQILCNSGHSLPSN